MWERLCLADARYLKTLQELAWVAELRKWVAIQWRLPGRLCLPHTLRVQGSQTPFLLRAQSCQMYGLDCTH